MKASIKKDEKTIEKIKESEPNISKDELASHPFLSFERGFLPILVFDASQKLDIQSQRNYQVFEKQTISKF